MTTTSRRQRHLATSPFAPTPEPRIETYALDDRVSHDRYGLGRVTGLEAAAVTVHFGGQQVRIPSPYSGMELL